MTAPLTSVIAAIKPLDVSYIFLGKSRMVMLAIVVDN